MNILKKFCYILVYFFFTVKIFSEGIFLSDYNYKTIEAGERVYINGLYGVESYSIDFNRKIFSDGGVLKFEGDRLLVGSLREDLIPGTVDTIIFSTERGMEYLELKISPSDFDLRIDNVKESVNGKVVFYHNNNFIKNGIDSLFIMYEADNNFESNIIFSTLEDTLIENNIFKFSLKKPEDEKDYSLSLVKFTGSLSDTFYYLEGFTTKEQPSNPFYPFIIDSRSKVITDNIENLYSDFNFDFIKTFYNYPLLPESIIIGNSKFLVYLNVDGGKLLKETQFLSRLKSISKNIPVFIFSRNIVQFLNLSENRSSKDFLEMMFDLEFREDEAAFDDYFLLDPLDEENYELFYDKVTQRYTPYYISDSISFFLYLPKSLNVDILNQIVENSKNLKKKDYWGRLSSVISLDNREKGEITISFFDFYGKFIGDVYLDINYLNFVFVDISSIFKKNFSWDNGFYIYKIYSGNEEINRGIFFLF
ncbi:TPA: hypothetical protein DCG82_07630 [candidate division WOR-3]|uniref:Uncharacterized protein n=2 Tax=Bacteria candidate phyla TaxID=1783234 RepID=A0A348MMI2_UNCW3|nr:hypothetical protein [candidate division WOR-3 bacterium]